MQNFNILAVLCSSTDWFESYLVGNPENRFSCIEAHNIRIYHECEGRIEKSIPRITTWYYEACRVMSNGDPEGQIFLSYPHTNNRLFFLLTTVFFILK